MISAFSKSAIVLLFSVSTGLAQIGVWNRTEMIWAEMEARKAAREQAERAAEEWRERYFISQAEEFIRAWNQFAEQYNSGKLDLRKAREVSDAFRKMERAGGWLAPSEDPRRKKRRGNDK